METSPLDENTPRYLAKGIALFEATDDELLPLRPIGIQVGERRGGGGQGEGVALFSLFRRVQNERELSLGWVVWDPIFLVLPHPYGLGGSGGRDGCLHRSTLVHPLTQP